VNAAIHHTDLGAGVTLDTDGETFNIDFDGGGAEFSILFNTYTNVVGILAQSANASWRGDASLTTWGSGGVSALNNGDEVNAGTKWGQKTNANTGNLAMYYSSAWYGGYFRGTTNKYLGVKFNIGTDTVYGWIQVQVPDADASKAIITGYAYNDDDGGSITAGAIPEPGSLALLALGAAGLAAWRKK